VHQVGFIYKIYEDCWFGSRYEKQILPRLQNIHSASEVHPASYSTLYLVLSCGLEQGAVKLITHPHRGPRLRTRGNIPPPSLWTIFLELCLNKHGVEFVLPFSTLWVRGNWKIVFVSIEHLTQITFTCDHKCLLFCDAPFTFFGASKLSSVMSFTKECIYLEFEFVEGASQ
jgi:hypothetical protein